MDIDIIDDESALREIYQIVIKDAGFKVNSYNSADDYISYTKSQIYSPPSIAVITDVRMPGKSGYALIEEVQKANPKQKFVVITGTPNDGYSNKVRACFYLQKPVKIDRLLGVITLLSSCCIAGDQHLAPACKVISDLDSFNITDWRCPHKK